MVSSIAAGPTLQLTPTTSAPCCSSAGTNRSRRAVQRVAVFFRCDLRDDRQVAQPADGTNRGADFVQVAERLEHEQLDPALEQRRRLLTEPSLRFVDTRAAPGLDPDAERADGARDPRLIARRVPSNAGPLDVHRMHAVSEAERPELHAIRAERVGFDHVGAGADVLLVNFPDEVGLGEVQLVETAVEEDPPRVEHGAGRTVAHEHAPIEFFQERRFAHRTVTSYGTRCDQEL
jgi:hypothetical protein